MMAIMLAQAISLLLNLRHAKRLVGARGRANADNAAVFATVAAVDVAAVVFD